MGMQISLLHVRRSIFINAPKQRVWHEFETTERIFAWLNLGHTVHEFVPEVGGSVRMSVEIDGADAFYGGSVLVYEPEQEISFSSQWDGEMAWDVPTYWTIRLTEMYGGTQVEIFHHGFDQLGAASADNLEGYEDGWNIIHLKALRKIVDG